MARSKIFLVIAVILLSLQRSNGVQPFACDPDDKTTNDMPFCKRTLPIEERVKDLVGRLTLQEKIRNLVNNAAAIPRLGVQKYEWWSEALHGVSNVGPGVKFDKPFNAATSFPQVITTAASFNATLWETIGQVVSDEARAMYNGGKAGLTYWSPNVNIFRDPRWGRGQETPGEDPLLTGTYAARYVRGLQGNDGNNLKVAACCKHYTAYDLDNWKGIDRFHFNAIVSKQDLEETYDPPFEMCVRDGNVASVMCSYNQVNGVPTCASPDLLRNTIRCQWSLNGYRYIVSDCDSVGVFYEQQHYTKTPEEAAAIAIKAGLNLDCGPFLAEHTQNAVNQSLIKESDINDAMSYLLAVQMRLGMFDGDPSQQKYGKLGPKDLCSSAHKELALDAARQGIVVLKNIANTLPLSTRTHQVVAVIGPNSDANVTMIGNYAGVPCGYISPLQGIERYAKAISQKGCVDVACANDQLFSEAIQAASEADATILVMGLNQTFEAEMVDRIGLNLPGLQQELVQKVAAASKGSVILVLMSGGPIDVSFAELDPKFSAILWAGYPGQAGGAAIADVLFGTTNPGGKLPMTWYPQQYVSNLSMTNMAMRASINYPGRTYKFYRGPVVYPFGHGLSYTRFIHRIIRAPKQIKISLYGHHRDNATVLGKAVEVSSVNCNKIALNFEIQVKNVGTKDGSDTLLVFWVPPASPWTPNKQLVAFEKVSVAAGKHYKVNFTIDVCKFMSAVDSSGIRRILMGQQTLIIGDDVEHILTLVHA